MLQLPCGLVLNNRLVKSAMSEKMITDSLPAASHERDDVWRQAGCSDSPGKLLRHCGAVGMIHPDLLTWTAEVTGRNGKVWIFLSDRPRRHFNIRGATRYYDV